MDTDLELTHLIELVDVDIKTAIIPEFHMFKKLKERVNLKVHTCKISKKTQVEILEMKTKMFEMKS